MLLTSKVIVAFDLFRNCNLASVLACKKSIPLRRVKQLADGEAEQRSFGRSCKNQASCSASILLRMEGNTDENRSIPQSPVLSLLYSPNIIDTTNYHDCMQT